MTNTWEAISGLIILVVGLYVFWHAYNTSVACNSLGGEISTAITSVFGGNGAQICYNAGILEIGGLISAVIGLVILYAGISNKTKTASKRR